MKKQTFLKLIILIIPILLGFVYLFRDSFISLGFNLPTCPSYTYLHLYCPGCGNTRSVQHLLAGDILGSIRYNPVPVLGLVLGTLFYLEIVLHACGMSLKLIPRSKKFWIVAAVVSVVYFIIRNVFKPF